MFRRLHRKPTKQSSALRGQKPKKRGDHGSNAEDSTWFTSPKTLVIVGLTVASLVLWSKKSSIQKAWFVSRDKISDALVLAPSEWTIQMTSPEGSPLGEDVRKEILKVSTGILKSGSPQELDELALAVEGIGTLERLHVVRPQFATVVISAGIREPVLLVQAGPKVRYLTGDGTVYGDATNPTSNPSGHTPSILVSGVFDVRGSNLPLDRSAKVLTTPEEQAVLINALNLWRLFTAQNLSVKVMNYQKFRGFDVRMEDGSEVVLGAAPFEYKIDKLVGIFTKLRKQGIAASRIELDYDGKAFIKERKL